MRKTGKKIFVTPKLNFFYCLCKKYGNMKIRNLQLIFSLLLVVASGIAQNSVTIEEYGSLLQEDYFLFDLKQTENYVITSGYDIHFNGIMNLYQKNINNMEQIGQWEFSPAYSTDSLMHINNFSIISPENIFYYSSYARIGDNIYSEIGIKSATGGTVVSKHFTNGGVGFAINDGVNYYVLFAADQFDSGDLDLPNFESFTFLFVIFSGEDLSILNYHIYDNFNVSVHDVQWMPNGNIAYKSRNYDTSWLIEINAENGEILDTLATGDRGDKYSFHGDYLVQNNVLLDAWNTADTLHALTIVDDIIGAEALKIVDKSIYGYSCGFYYKSSFDTDLTNEIIPNVRKRAVSEAMSENVVSEYMNEDKSVDVLREEDDNVTFYRVRVVFDYQILLNPPSTEIHSVYNGKVFEEDEAGLFVGSYYRELGAGATYLDRIFIKAQIKDVNEVVLTETTETASETSVSIYPNPARDFINISSRQNISTIQIYNLMGEEIFSKKGNFFTEAVVNLSNYENAVYYLVVLGENNATSIRKIIKY